MARLASNERQPYSSSYQPSYTTETLSLPEALKRVAAGRMDAASFYSQLPSELAALVDAAGGSVFGKEFVSLTSDERKTLIEGLLVAVSQAQTKSPAMPNSGPTSEVGHNLEREKAERENTFGAAAVKRERAVRQAAVVHESTEREALLRTNAIRGRRRMTRLLACVIGVLAIAVTAYLYFR